VLLYAGAAQAADPFRGRWSIDPAGCRFAGNTAATSPLVLSEKSVTWFKSSCTIKKTYRIGDGLFLQAHCSNAGSNAKTMPIGLQLQGPDRIKLTWDKTAAGEMRRCH
jgi:hypothetical protein